jgi:hypothetical protein
MCSSTTHGSSACAGSDGVATRAILHFAPAVFNALIFRAQSGSIDKRRTPRVAYETCRNEHDSSTRGDDAGLLSARHSMNQRPSREGRHDELSAPHPAFFLFNGITRQSELFSKHRRRDVVGFISGQETSPMRSEPRALGLITLQDDQARRGDMAIVWDTNQGCYCVKDRLGFSKSTARAVDRTTAEMQQWVPGALGRAEKSYNPTIDHGKQGSMRAHHVADHVIQEAICDYLNARGGPSAFAAMLNRIGTLYQTSWIDLIVTERIAIIWGQWVHALGSACVMAIKQVVGTEAEIARSATDLASVLSSSLANLRVGHGATDGRLANAIAPRMRNGEVTFDLPYLFASWASGQLPLLRQPTLSFETTLVAQNWDSHFQAHALPTGNKSNPKSIVINNVFLATTQSEIFISEDGTLGNPRLATVSASSIHNYPGTDGWGLTTQRIGRAFLHVLPLVVTGYFILETVGSLGSSFGLADLLSFTG